jgi:hypothetical protein
MAKQMTTKKICTYCGEFPANMKIENPNYDEFEEQPEWDVCPTCAKVIPLQQEMSTAYALKDMCERNGLDPTKHTNRLKEINKQLADIERESDIPTFSIVIEKKKEDEENDK